MSTFTNNSSLVLDSSGIDPIEYSLSKGFLEKEQIDSFFNICGINLYHSAALVDEFKHSFNSQGSLFDRPLGEELVVGQVIYLSDTGDFSSVSILSGIESTTVTGQESSQQNSLWSTSPFAQDLSAEDWSTLRCAQRLRSSYGDDVASLTNDWHLRQQLELEGISVYGTCSLLAGMVLSDELSLTYQKGTAIYKQWKEFNLKWVPNHQTEYRKMTFAEVLDVERRRKKAGKSFWRRRREYEY